MNEPPGESVQQAEPAKSSLLSSAEGRLLLAGVGIAFAYTLWLVVMTVMYPELSQVLIGMTATAVLFGRAAGMAFGYSVGCGHGAVVAVARPRSVRRGHSTAAPDDRRPDRRHVAEGVV